MPSNICFVICPIGDEDSEDRKRSDQLFKHLLKPIADQFGYDLERADKMAKSGMITTQILKSVIEAPLVIADLTSANPNVYYELALRHAVNKPFIQLIKESQKIPFDIHGVRTIHYNLSNLDKVDQTRSELEKQIRSIRSGHNPDSPISLALASDALGIPENVLEVFLEKFWNIEDGIEQANQVIKRTAEETTDVRDLTSDLVSYIENDIDERIERVMEDKLMQAVTSIVEQIKPEN